MFFVVIAIGAAILLAIAMIVGLPTEEPETAAQDRWMFLHESLMSQRQGYHPGLSEIEEIGQFPRGSLNWFQDDTHVESTALGLQAFRRCSGDSDKPTCVLVLADLYNEYHARVVTTAGLRDSGNQYPVAFTPNGLFFVTPPDLLFFDVHQNSARVVAEDAWTPGPADDGRLLAYLTSYRSGGANVHVLHVSTESSRQLTQFQGKSPGGQDVRWLPGTEKLVFELQDDRTYEIETWLVGANGDGLRKLADGQVFDLESLQ